VRVKEFRIFLFSGWHYKQNITASASLSMTEVNNNDRKTQNIKKCKIYSCTATTNNKDTTVVRFSA